jgi:hypothetical protein
VTTKRIDAVATVLLKLDYFTADEAARWWAGEILKALDGIDRHKGSEVPDTIRDVLARWGQHWHVAHWVEAECEWRQPRDDFFTEDMPDEWTDLPPLGAEGGGK